MLNFMMIKPSGLTFGKCCNGAWQRALAYVLFITIFFSCVAINSTNALAAGSGQASNGPNNSPVRDPSESPENLIGHGGPIKSIVVSHDGRRALTGSFDYTMMLWDIGDKSAKRLQRFTDHDAPVNVVRFFNNDARALSGSDDGTLGLWDIKSQTLLTRLKGHSAKIVDIATSKNGKLAATASWDRTVRLWNLTRKTNGLVLNGHSGPVNTVLISQNADNVFSGGYDGTIRKWNARSGDTMGILHKHGWGINVMRFLPGEDNIIFGTLNGDAQILKTTTGEIIKILVPHESPVLALALSDKHGLLATGGGDGVIRIWKIADWSLLEEFQNPYGPVWSLAFNRDGSSIYYSGLDDYVISWMFKPRKPFEIVPSRYPRRFQKTAGLPLGERQFARKCSVCHTLKPHDGNRAGPTLHKIFGRKAGTIANYPYSKGLRESKIVWNAKTISQLFDLGPDRLTPGSKMPLQKIIDPNKRDALIAFLKKATIENN